MAEAGEKKDEKTEIREDIQEATEPAPVESEADLEQLQKKLGEAQKAADTYKDQLLRKAAEFENYKRRMESDFGNLIRSANESLILSLLPILDDLRRSLKQGKDLKPDDPFFKGIEMIQNKFSKLLEQQGVVPFESEGKPFDVEYHDALLQLPSESIPAHTVVEEVERGYMLNGRVLRHAKVIVSSGSRSTGEPSNGDGKDEPKEAKNP